MSNQTIVAVYDTPAHAELAVNDLLEANVPEAAVHRHTSTGSYAAGASARTTHRSEDRGGFWASLFGGDAGGDHSVYDQSMAGGGTVVTVTGVPDHDYPTVLAILESHRPVDLDERSRQFGIGAVAGDAASAATATDEPTSGESEAMQLAEETLVVGKRLVNRGGTRVRRYVMQTPVEQTISLHSEIVTVTRRAVIDDTPVTDLDFADKTIEMTQTMEEAVVSKTARVVEEVVLRKDATDRVETVRDTVRKEQVEIQQLPGVAAELPMGADSSKS